MDVATAHNAKHDKHPRLQPQPPAASGQRPAASGHAISNRQNVIATSAVVCVNTERQPRQGEGRISKSSNDLLNCIQNELHQCLQFTIAGLPVP
jgi:hypothetical protein